MGELVPYTRLTFIDREPMSLYHPGNRGLLVRVEDRSLQPIYDYLDSLGLKPYKNPDVIGRRSLSTHFASISLPNFGSDQRTDIKLGVAISEIYKKGESPRAEMVIVRESEGFLMDDFGEEAKWIIQKSTPRVPRRYKGIEAGFVTGALTAGVAAGYYSGDWLIGSVAGVCGGIAGAYAGQHNESCEQWELSQAVPELNEYFGNVKALDRLKRVDDHKTTTEALAKLDLSLKKKGVLVPETRVLELWNNAAVSEVQGKYNSAADAEIREQLFQDMVDRVIKLAK